MNITQLIAGMQLHAEHRGMSAKQFRKANPEKAKAMSLFLNANMGEIVSLITRKITK